MSETRDYTENVRQYYNENTVKEWDRLGKHRAEFEITRRFMDRYMLPGHTVLDVGGGPGRYFLYLARKGCDVTLLDLSEGNVAMALENAKLAGVSVRALTGDARQTSDVCDEVFDHVLVMGPLYHLVTEEDRAAAIVSCLERLKPGGLLYASFINNSAGIIWLMKNMPEQLGANPHETELMERFVQDRPIDAQTFTHTYFTRWKDITPFMDRFALEKLHLFGQEGVCAPCEPAIMAQSEEVVGRWLDLSERVCQREDLLCFAEHVMYIGRKPYV